MIGRKISGLLTPKRAFCKFFEFLLETGEIEEQVKKRFFGWAKTGKHVFFCVTPTGLPDEFIWFSIKWQWISAFSSIRLSAVFLTETALRKVITDIFATLDRGQISLLDMFDLNAAFDTVDHSILLRRLEISFGIWGVALEWFSSYLTGRSQQVSVHNVMAMFVFIDYGMPHGSVLGPVLFLQCTSDLVELVRSSGLLAYGYADDLQVYCHIHVGSEQIMLRRFRDLLIL